MAKIKTNSNAPELFRLENFGGIDYSSTPTQISTNRSPDMLNMLLDEIGALNKRTGYSRVYTTSLGAGKINGLFEYKKIDGTTKFLIAHGTKLYTQTGSNQPAEIYSGLANSRVRFFVMNDKCYIMDGANYLVYDGTTVAAVTPYIPTISISKPPAGGGTVNEDFNLLGAGFIDSFNGDGVATEYQLSLTNLDATAIVASIDGGVTYNKVETTDFTVNRTTGKVTWTVAQATGTNNVLIKAYRTQTGFANRIKKCTLQPVFFGGSNDTRVFVSGNPDYPNWIWRSGVYDPSYFPENGFTKVGSDSTAIKAFAKQYDTCVIIKEYAPNTSPIWSMAYELNSGEASFPIKPVNDEVGCDAPDSIQIVNNYPTWLSKKKGIQRLVSSTIRDERNIQHVSKRVEPNLLSEANLQNAATIDHDNKYWLAVNGKVYVWDYNHILNDEDIGEWVLLNNIPASCFLEKDGYLYFGSSSAGLVYKFKKTTDVLPYNDDGVSINAYWKSKQTSFFADERRKLVDRAFFSLKPDYKTSADFYYISDKKESGLLKTLRVDLIDFTNFDFTIFSFLTSSFPQEAMVKVKAKKIVYFQVMLKNDKLNESMGILSLGLKWRPQSEVK